MKTINTKSVKLLLAIIIVIFIFGGTSPLNTVTASTEIPVNVIDIYVNGQLIENYYDNQRAFFDSMGRVQIPLRTLAEAMGFTVEWNQQTKTITIPIENGKKVATQLYSNKVTTPDGEITMDTKSVSIGGRTYVPVRFIAEALGWEVGYKKLTDNSGASEGKATHMVTVTKKGTSDSTETTTDGIMVDGVRNPGTEGTLDMSSNAYISSFMLANYADDTYIINPAGVKYSSFGLSSGITTIRASIDRSNGYWYFEIVNFEVGKERPILLASLKAISSNYQTIYDKFVEMYDNSPDYEYATKNYQLNVWQTVDKTKFIFATTQSGKLEIRIKY